MSSTPLAYLSSEGQRAGTIVPLTWFTLGVSIIVCLIIGVLVLIAARRAQFADPETLAVERRGNGMRWIGIGVVLTSVPLAITLVWTIGALANTVGPPRRPGLVLDVTGHQWWWQVDYNGATPSERFATANEIHIPVGEKVLVRLHGADVIHSFWVPKLSGKTDAIPGQTNLSWIEADRPGVYRGQCTEYCGAEHARMGFEVVAEPPAQFERWRAAQLQTAPPPATPAQLRGAQLFQFRCSLCHAVRGTNAASHYGPDLSHIASRRMIAAGMLPNNPGTLTGWIENPQAVKPGALMPDQHLSGQQLTDLTAYLETLK
jgi:cytochrome c oxidase subunit 2